MIRTIAVLLASAPFAFSASAPASAFFLTASDLSAKCTKVGQTNPYVDYIDCLGYVTGIADVLTGDGGSINGVRACLPQSVTREGLVDQVTKWLAGNPAVGHLPAAGVVASALADGFPCPPH
jgi:hypothetical protein